MSPVGDFQIDARGSTALVERDTQNQQIGGRWARWWRNPAFGSRPGEVAERDAQEPAPGPQALPDDQEKKAAMAQQLPPVAPRPRASVQICEADLQKAQLAAQKDAQIA